MRTTTCSNGRQVYSWPHASEDKLTVGSTKSTTVRPGWARYCPQDSCALELLLAYFQTRACSLAFNGSLLLHDLPTSRIDVARIVVIDSLISAQMNKLQLRQYCLVCTKWGVWWVRSTTCRQRSQLQFLKSREAMNWRLGETLSRHGNHETKYKKQYKVLQLVAKGLSFLIQGYLVDQTMIIRMWAIECEQKPEYMLLFERKSGDYYYMIAAILYSQIWHRRHVRVIIT